jgi:type IV pilus assembly protein PilY1
VSKLWTGDVKSYAISQGGQIADTVDWSASARLAQQIRSGSRQILTYNSTTASGVPFRWPEDPSSPSATEISRQQADLLSTEPVSNSPDNRGSDRLDYIRGETVPDFRVRSGALGDIVHSSPQLVAAPGYYYPDNWGTGAPENSAPYSSFARDNRTRQRVVYVGANDGMLHAFDAGTYTDGSYSAGTGRELFAYVPGVLYKNLPELTHPRYTHKYYVDGTPAIGDAFDGQQWRTVLVGGLRQGGQGIYALDVTDPGSVNEANAAGTVLWEFTDADDADLGYTYSTPIIARMNNGRWAAVFSSGYGSTENDDHKGNGRPALYIVDLFTGALQAKLQPNADIKHHGLSEPTAVDLDGNRTVDMIYAGDLGGFVHGYDVTGTSGDQWVSDNRRRHILVFRARTEDGLAQPITSAISVGSHPTGEGLLLFFGTGKYLEPNDQSESTRMHSVYAVWDKLTGRKQYDNDKTTQNLLKQNISGQSIRALDSDGDGIEESSVEVRVSTQRPINWNTHRGWYVDLIYNSPEGEQVVAKPVLRDGKLFVTTHIPSGDECNPQQDGWLMVFDPGSGAMINDSPFDLDGDGSFRNDNSLTGIQIDGNPFAAPTFAATATDDVLLIQSETNPVARSMIVDASMQNGRLSWRELEP